MNHPKLTETEIQYIKQGKRVKAIIAYCQRTGVSLTEAKEVINSWDEFDDAFERTLAK